LNRIMIAGGPPGAAISEARVGRDWLISRGASPVLIETEENSRNTLENLIQVRHALGDKNQERIIIISSRYHLARCHAIASGLGLRHELCASEEKLRFDYYNIKRIIIESYFMNW